jgi:hypothetical protein
VTVYLCSSVTFFNWIGSSVTTRFKRDVVGFSAHNTTSCTQLSPWRRRPKRGKVDWINFRIEKYRLLVHTDDATKHTRHTQWLGLTTAKTHPWPTNRLAWLP